MCYNYIYGVKFIAPTSCHMVFYDHNFCITEFVICDQDRVVVKRLDNLFD